MLAQDDEVITVESPRAGGIYAFQKSSSMLIQSIGGDAKLMLTTWLCDQRRAGNRAPEIPSDVTLLLASRKKLHVTERLARALQFIGRRAQPLGTAVSLGAGQNNKAFYAETESVDEREVHHLCVMLCDMGWVKGNFHAQGMCSISPSPEGWNHLYSLESQAAISEFSQAFVAMWFHKKTEDAYSQGIFPALIEAGYDPLRIDKKEHNNKIDDEIILEIRRSRFLIADFTCEPNNARGGVYFEAGYAQGLGKQVIWTCHRSCLNYLHFDTRQYSHIVWDEPGDLFSQLRNRIGATIGEGPKARR